jgi:hypothetical protein
VPGYMIKLGKQKGKKRKKFALLGVDRQDRRNGCPPLSFVEGGGELASSHGNSLLAVARLGGMTIACARAGWVPKAKTRLEGHGVLVWPVNRPEAAWILP